MCRSFVAMENSLLSIFDTYPWLLGLCAKLSICHCCLRCYLRRDTNFPCRKAAHVIFFFLRLRNDQALLIYTFN